MGKRIILVVGDHFIASSLMKEALAARLGEDFEYVEASTPFPITPFHSIAEVKEASGSEEQMIDGLQGASICVVHHAPLSKRVLEYATGLKLAVVCRGGPVNANIAAATKQGIAIGYTPGRNAAATAEHTVAMLLSALRRIPESDAEIRRGEWKGNYTYETAGIELETATAGLVGYGAVGKIVARILRGFGTRVLAYDPFLQPNLLDAGVEQVEFHDLLARANIVSLHARATKESRGMIGRNEIARMQRGSVLVNCARGSLLDYEAMIDALYAGHLYGAAADVFPEEPIAAGSRLLSAPNFVMTPHIAGGTRQAAHKAVKIAAEEVERFVKNKPLLYCANPQVLAGLRSTMSQ
ncbi:MAG: 2-hydroxyacid dehydrogenase [Acidobacteriaceae bacterium]